MNPYGSLPSSAFWRTAVAEPEPRDIRGLWTPKFAVGQDDMVLTAGSCFARHIGRALLEHGMFWHEAEFPPPGLTRAERDARQYGAFSFRTGNIYTAAVLRQWLSWAFEESAPPAEVWEEEGRWYDPMRPSVEPEGYASAEDVARARAVTLEAIRGAVSGASCLVFTLGLTEAWRGRADGTVYPVCPGTVRGTYDAELHEFHNFTFDEVYGDLCAALALARRANPELRLLLTVSPVPLTATASGGHALTATTYSKSVLRAVAGQLAQELDYVDYFPSYEIVTGFPYRAAFFEPNLRSVTPAGVDFVMGHFFDGIRPAPRTAAHVSGQAPRDDARTDDPTTAHTAHTTVRSPAHDSGEDLWCDDAVLDYYNPR
ncbi:GSCFA domain-containing protein [Streptomyces sp. NPDC050504]|uniref:GSCFA domain-containing protein n=1 Tax=Streptomyces sp. NPDC050504 TaxID=3365618 RepID=UPI00379450E1